MQSERDHSKIERTRALEARKRFQQEKKRSQAAKKGLATVRIEQAAVLPATSRDDLALVLAEISLAKLHTLSATNENWADLEQEIAEAENLVDAETERLAARIRARPRTELDVTLDAAIAILDHRPVSGNSQRTG